MGEKFYAKFLKMEIDLDELSSSIESILGFRYRLVPLGVKCTYPVFRGEMDGVAPIFVKVGTQDEWRRTRDLLCMVGNCKFFSRFITEQSIDYKGYAVFVMEWKDARSVLLEDMNPRQLESFVAGCVRLSSVLTGASGVLETKSQAIPVDTPRELYKKLLHYVSRHPIVGWVLKSLVTIPESERTYGNRSLVVCHGDFHAKNCGFSGDEFAAVFDFDKLTYGLACADFVHAFVWQFSRLGLSVDARQRLSEVARDMVALCPWQRDELVIVCNVVRLQFATQRIAKHPNSILVAFDVWRRDRKIREFLQCIEQR